MLGRVLLLVSFFSLSFLFPGTLQQQVIKPPRVQPGDVVGFISPASPPYYLFNSSLYKEHVIESMTQLGNLTVKFGAHAFEEIGYLAGNDSDRAADVMSMFSDPTVKFIIANRGGWGCNRIIDLLDYSVIKANPKPIMGYSDLTSLLTAIYTMTGMVTMSGPMGVDYWSTGLHIWNTKYVQQVLFQAETVTFQSLPQYAKKMLTINSGKAKGKLIGGNLTLFSSLIGTKYLPLSLMQGAILFLEDIDVGALDVDRMLTSLHLAGYLDHIAGFVFGICHDCGPDYKETLTLHQVLEMRFGYNSSLPAFAGAMFGHDLVAQYTLPIGIMVEIDADQGTIEMLEPAVI